MKKTKNTKNKTNAPLRTKALLRLASARIGA
jgi:hypothetical protein